MPIRLLLVDDHGLFREIAARVLSAEPDMLVAGHSETVEEALDALDGTAPDVVLLDYDLNGRSGMEFVIGARRQGFGGHVLFLSAAIPAREVYEAVRRGVAGLVLKEESFERLLAAIRTVAAGGTWIEERHIATPPDARDCEFTLRERYILTGLLDGLSNKEIAGELNVPEMTVKSGLQLLFKKTGVRTRGSLVRVAMEKYRHLLVRARGTGMGR